MYVVGDPACKLGTLDVYQSYTGCFLAIPDSVGFDSESLGSDLVICETSGVAQSKDLGVALLTFDTIIYITNTQFSFS